MSDHDFRPAFDRLARIHGWDQLDTNAGPPIIHAPTVIPPAARDLATVQHTAAWRRALGRVVKRGVA